MGVWMGQRKPFHFKRAKANRLWELGPVPSAIWASVSLSAEWGWMTSSLRTLLILRATENAGREQPEPLGTPTFTI